MSKFLDSVLPSAPVPVTLTNPRTMLLYGGYKIGKSVIAGIVANKFNALWLDYESGSECQESYRINVVQKAAALGMKKLDFLEQLWAELAAEPAPRYGMILHDKLDNLEEWAECKATAYFKQTVIGRNFTGKSILELDKGGGYEYLRSHFKEIWNAAIAAAPSSVFLASLRDRQIDKLDTTVSSNDLDLTGKVRKIASGYADTVGYLYRESDGSNWVSFVTSEKGTFAGSRIPRLEGQRFKLSWKDASGALQVDWKAIFPDAKERVGVEGAVK